MPDDGAEREDAATELREQKPLNIENVEKRKSNPSTLLFTDRRFDEVYGEPDTSIDNGTLYTDRKGHDLPLNDALDEKYSSSNYPIIPPELLFQIIKVKRFIQLHVNRFQHIML